jgi:hypothetical protein
MSYTEDILNECMGEGRVVQDVDKIPDSDTREEDLIELIDFKNTPSYGLFRVMEDLV